MIHPEPSPLAGQTVDIAFHVPSLPSRTVAGTLTVEDWWDRVDGRSWHDCDGVMAVVEYALRAGLTGPDNGLQMVDDEVLYGELTIGGRDAGKALVHLSEILPATDEGASPRNLYDVLAEPGPGAPSETIAPGPGLDQGGEL